MRNTVGSRLHKSWPRLTRAAAVMGAISWFLWPNEHWRAEGEPAVVLAGTVLTWLYFELFAGAPEPSGNKEAAADRPAEGPHPHDLRLITRFDELIPRADRTSFESTISERRWIAAIWMAGRR